MGPRNSARSSSTRNMRNILEKRAYGTRTFQPSATTSWFVDSAAWEPQSAEHLTARGQSFVAIDNVTDIYDEIGRDRALALRPRGRHRRRRSQGRRYHTRTRTRHRPAHRRRQRLRRALRQDAQQQVQIIARASDDEAMKKLQHAGAPRASSAPSAAGAVKMARFMLNPSLEDFSGSGRRGGARSRAGGGANRARKPLHRTGIVPDQPARTRHHGHRNQTVKRRTTASPAGERPSFRRKTASSSSATPSPSVKCPQSEELDR